jgi:hypothetical protein
MEIRIVLFGVDGEIMTQGATGMADASALTVIPKPALIGAPGLPVSTVMNGDTVLSWVSIHKKIDIAAVHPALKEHQHLHLRSHLFVKLRLSLPL